MQQAIMAEFYDDDVDITDGLEGNDEDFDALDTILSWDEDEGNESNSQQPTDLPQLPQYNNDSAQYQQTTQQEQAAQQTASVPLTQIQQQQNPTKSNGSGGALPMPTPLSILVGGSSAVTQQQQQDSQAQQRQSMFTVATQDPVAPQAAPQSAAPQSAPANSAQMTAQQQAVAAAVAQAQQQGLSASNVAQLKMLVQQFQQQQQQPTTQQAFNQEQQRQLRATLAQAQPFVLQQQPAARPDVQQQQSGVQQQLPFAADTNAFLQQLQRAAAQQQQQVGQPTTKAAPSGLMQQQQQFTATQQQQQLQALFIQHQRQGMAAPLQVPSSSLGSVAVANGLNVPPAKKQKVLGRSNDISINRKNKTTPSQSKKTAVTPMVTNPTHTVQGIVSSDTDGEASRKGRGSTLGSKPQTLTGSTSTKKLPVTDDSDVAEMPNLSVEEKAKGNRERNKQHARNTRLRKKAYLEKLKTTVDELCRERDTLVSERAGAANLVVEMHNTRTEMLMSFFALRSANERRRTLWSSILDEACFSCVMPVTPYRSFPASEVQVSKCQRTLLGIDAIMSDTSSLHVLLNSLVDRSKFPNGKIDFRYTLVTEEAAVAGNQMMARWAMSTVNAVAAGARAEVAKQGMLCCKFNSAHKMTGLELMFDVMAFMLQLKQASGTEVFSVIPNTVQTCQREFKQPMLMQLAEPPYSICQVNKLWESMTGYSADEVVGKLCQHHYLAGDLTNKSEQEKFLAEVRFKRPVASTMTHYSKTGKPFEHTFIAYPLSTDSRITHYLILTQHTRALDAAAQQQAIASSQTQALASISLNKKHQQPSTAPSESPLVSSTVLTVQAARAQQKQAQLFAAQSAAAVANGGPIPSSMAVAPPVCELKAAMPPPPVGLIGKNTLSSSRPMNIATAHPT